MGDPVPGLDRTKMLAMSGKLVSGDNAEFDLTETMQMLRTTITDERITVIASAHREIHEADAYISDAVVDATELILAWRTPDTDKHMHMFAEFATEGPGHMDILRGPTWDTGTGAQNPAYNRDENSENHSAVLEDTTGAFVASMNVVQDPVGFAGGVTIHNLYTWADKKTGGERRENKEFILARNMDYAVRLTSDAAGAQGMQVILNWYEHERTNGGEG